MSESGDYTSASWSSGHSFSKARSAYADEVVSRSYGKAISAGKSALDLVEASLVSDAKRSLILAVDHTGSMGERTGIIFAKYPYLIHEVQTEYLGADTDICLVAVGDAEGDTYPLEVRPLVKTKKDLEKELKALVIEGGGGEGGTESYELACLYFCRNATFPKALHKPIMIITGDEGPKDQVTPDQAKMYAHIHLEKSISAKDIFKELLEKYEVYYILNPYGSSGAMVRERLDVSSQAYYRKWCSLLGDDRVVILPDPDRVVDVIFGILAKVTDKIEYFKEEIEDRQKPEQVATVYKALHTIHALPAPTSKPKKVGDSKLRSTSTGPKSKPLM